MSYPLETDQFGNAIPPLKPCEPSKRVPKKYWKYANVFPGRQLYAVGPRKLGLLVKCYECKRLIQSMEEHVALYFRWPNTKWSGKRWMALCKECATGC